MAAIIVVGEHLSTLASYGRALQGARGFRVHLAHGRSDAIDMLEASDVVDLVLAALDHDELPNEQFLRRLRVSRPTVPIVIVTSRGSIRAAVEAMRLGASDYVERPESDAHIVDIVCRNLALQLTAQRVLPAQATAYAAGRWARAVAPIVVADVDPKTVEGWARCIAASPGAIRNWCNTANIRPRSSLVFARVLRAILRRRDGLSPNDLLDVADVRTLDGLLRVCGLSLADHEQWPTDIDSFIDRQSVIRDVTALSELRRALSGLL